MTYPHVPAAFIHALAEEGTKAEAIEYLQRYWNEACALRAALREIADDPCIDPEGNRQIARDVLSP